MTAHMVPVEPPKCRHDACWAPATHDVHEPTDDGWSWVIGPFCEIHARMKLASLKRTDTRKHP